MASRSADATRPHPVQVAAPAALRGAPKIVLCGEPGVGKTALVRTMLTGHFEQEITTTLGAEKVELTTDSNRTINLWDVAGQMLASANNTMVFRHAHAFIVVAALTDSGTIDAIRRWLLAIRYHYAKSTDTPVPPSSPPSSPEGLPEVPMPYPTYVVFNKRDLVEPTPEEKEAFRRSVKAWGCHDVFFTTAKEQADVRGMFTSVGDDVSKKLVIENEARQKVIDDMNKPAEKTGGGCPCGGGGSKEKDKPAMKRRK